MIKWNADGSNIINVEDLIWQNAGGIGFNEIPKD
jgi:hypothetical protein